jgi:hypothetical protein
VIRKGSQSDKADAAGVLILVHRGELLITDGALLKRQMFVNSGRNVMPVLAGEK